MAKTDPIKLHSVRDGILPHRLSIGDVLQNTEKEFALFTPALLFTHGGFDRDPVVEFASYYSEVSTLRPACIDLSRDNEFFFRGLGTQPAPKTKVPVNWDKRLYAIPVAAADECFAFLAGIGWSNPQTGFFGRAFSYAVNIPDPTAAKPQWLAVRVFGVLANTAVAFLDAATTPPVARVIQTTAPETVLAKLGFTASNNS